MIVLAHEAATVYSNFSPNRTYESVRGYNFVEGIARTRMSVDIVKQLDRAKRFVEKSRLALKERLLSGEFGAIRGGTLSAMWPRPSGYFARNAWCGRLFVGDHIVLDSVVRRITPKDGEIVETLRCAKFLFPL